MINTALAFCGREDEKIDADWNIWPSWLHIDNLTVTQVILIFHKIHFFVDPSGLASKASVCGRSSAGISGSNPSRGMDISILCCK